MPNLSGFLAYEFDYPKRLMMKGFYGTIFEQNSVDITEKTSLIRGEVKGGLSRGPQGQDITFLQSVRKSLQHKIISAY